MNISSAATIAALVLTLTACSADDGDVVRDDSSPPKDASPAPTSVPAAAGPVRTANLAMVMDDGDGPVELCLGAVAESYPPQCGGPTLTNWDWAMADGAFDEAGGSRFGYFALTGTWDGEAFAVTDLIPAALYDTIVPDEAAPPEPETVHDAARLEEIAVEVAELPGVEGAYSDGTHVFTDVIYDDGSYADYLDATYGADVVQIYAALIPASDAG